MNRNLSKVNDTALLHLALAIVDSTISRLNKRKVKSFEELSRLHDEKQYLTKQLYGAKVDCEGKGFDDLHVYYKLDSSTCLIILSACSREWRA